MMLIVIGLIKSPGIEQKTANNETDPEGIAASFYKGKNIKLIVPHAPGGGYDESARLIMPYLEKCTGT